MHVELTRLNETILLTPGHELLTVWPHLYAKWDDRVGKIADLINTSVFLLHNYP